MGKKWQDEYVELFLKRMEFQDLSLKPGGETNINAILADFDNRLSILFDAASSGDDSAKVMYLLLCEDYLNAAKQVYKSSQQYFIEYNKIVSNLNKLTTP